MVSKKIAIIGTADTVLPFKAIGVDGYAAEDTKKADIMLDDLMVQNYGIIFVEEAYAKDFSDKIQRLNFSHREVSIIVLPGSKGGEGLAKEKLAGLVKRAIGIDIFAVK
jgi:V/A-type H+-transporting ATPase subunit F